MAILKHLEKGNYEATSRLTDTWGKYNVTSLNGERLFHIETYGSADREYEGKVSQQIEINEHMAKELLGLLNRFLEKDI